ncbi:MAG TPA: AzlC family ABC transporter permease [Gaiellaceae bacterium]
MAERPGWADRREPGATFRAGLGVGAVFALPTFVLAVSFGVLARSLDWGVVAPVVFSAVVFSGSAQFAVADVLDAGGSALAAIVAALLVNARFAVMGVAVASSLAGGRLRRAIEAQATVDASWAVANRGGGRFERKILIGATLPQYVAWVCGTAIGVAAGDSIGDPEALGLDVLFPAFFLGLLVEELRQGRRQVWAALIAAGVALVLIPFAPPGIPIIASCVGALIALWGRRDA